MRALKGHLTHPPSTRGVGSVTPLSRLNPSFWLWNSPKGECFQFARSHMELALARQKVMVKVLQESWIQICRSEWRKKKKGQQTRTTLDQNTAGSSNQDSTINTRLKKPFVHVTKSVSVNSHKTVPERARKRGQSVISMQLA